MQKLKAKAKAVAAVATGALMVGATLAGSAMAVDLGDFPGPFVEDNEWNCVGVLGTGGTSRSGLAEDIIASAQVLTTLAQHTVPIEETEPTGLTGVAKVIVSGVSGESDEVELFDALNNVFGTNLDDLDLPMLIDKQYSATGGDSYDVEETVILGSDIKIDQYEGDLGIEIPGSQLKYQFGFKDEIDDSNDDGMLTCADWEGDDADDVGTMDVEILGHDITVTCLTNTTLKVQGGNEAVLNIGESVEYTSGDDTWEIELKAVSEDSDKAYFLISKNGGSAKSAVIDVDSQKSESGIDVSLEEAFTTGTGSDAFAEIKYGDELSDTLTDGEEWPFDEDYEVSFPTLSNNMKPAFQLVYAPDESIEDEDAIGMDERWQSYKEAFDIKNKGLYVDDTVSVTIERTAASVYESMTDGDTGSEETIHMNIPDEMSMYNASSTSVELYDDLWLVRSGGAVVINSRNSDGTKLAIGKSDMVGYDPDPGSSALLSTGSYGSTDLKLWWNNTNEILTLEIEEMENLTIVTYNDATDFIELVGADGDAVSSDLVYNGTLPSGAAMDDQIGTDDYDFWTAYGLLVADPQDNLESGDGKVELTIPESQQKLVVLIGKEEPTTRDLSEGESYGDVEIDEITVSGTIREAGDVMPIAVDVAKLDTEIADPTATNMVIFGGPSVNALAADLGYTKSDFMDGSTKIGLVELVENAFGGTNTAMIVAGYDAVNTRMAAWVAAHYPDYDLDGKTRLVVKGTSAEELDVE